MIDPELHESPRYLNYEKMIQNNWRHTMNNTFTPTALILTFGSGIILSMALIFGSSPVQIVAGAAYLLFSIPGLIQGRKIMQIHGRDTGYVIWNVCLFLALYSCAYLWPVVTGIVLMVVCMTSSVLTFWSRRWLERYAAIS